ncbi:MULTISPECIES: hypothetical protein [Cupriavidus]|uniref:Uncharacterized protein n=2 Tax=Cupriavidus TaxID=106589 RepID=A0A7Z7JGB7_9BURK|nr:MULTISPECIES: hypothetical protein [Cupriavidus]NOV27864.1 hypothetical protein [Cupriavidus necator]QEZ48638.1 hypothetical protein D2917_30535 [Cupriavidus oxalaticus]SOZ18613.1 conserved hypothetical protein [Cupriavidus taiwanensis]SOZ96740.1 conserved hypothetical protein [Cupriavidus taiwanensis]SPC26061.1 conserved hypothetical protein [Cupriavidus taiwanensis]
MVFSDARRELRELIQIVAETERYDATLAADRSIAPHESAVADRQRKELRKAQLMAKYELV